MFQTFLIGAVITQNASTALTNQWTCVSIWLFAVVRRGLSFYCRKWLVKKSQPINHWLINAICAACEAGTAKAHSRTNLTRPREADETMWKMIKKSSSKTNTNCALEKRRRGKFFGFGSEHTAQETPRLSISIERRHDTQKGKKKWWQRKEEKNQ